MNTKQLSGYPSIDKPWLKYYTEEAINAELPKCLKMAYNSADSYSLQSEITSYALSCGIDLDKVSGYDY